MDIKKECLDCDWCGVKDQLIPVKDDVIFACPSCSSLNVATYYGVQQQPCNSCGEWIEINDSGYCDECNTMLETNEL